MNDPLRVFAPTLLVLAALSAGCAGSAPLRYYSLQVSSPAAVDGTSAPAAAGTRSLLLESVQIPPELDRQEVVTHAGAYQVRISDEARWAAPLEDQIRRTVQDDLAARLPPGTVLDRLSAGGQKEPRLIIDVQQFYTDARCRTILQAAWAIRNPESDLPVAIGTEAIQQAASGVCMDPAQEAAAGMSLALGQFADRLATAIGRWSVE